jgi:hypothetical protein
MGLQRVDGRYGYVVEFDELPELPITWSKRKEAPYALALGQAIEEGLLTKPGKYMIVITGNDYEIFTINEDEGES